MVGRRHPFGPDRLAQQLAELLPGYPHISLCVALSGGLDSTALLAALAALNYRPLRAVHVNHGLHANADRWTQHCRRVAKSLRVPIKVLTVNVDRSPGTSLEAEARRARYAALASALEENEALLTAHHEDDQLETLMLQLLRGAGLAGLAAMPPVARFADGWQVRPLLQTSRAELEEWARAQSLTWIEDDTNADERLDRNYLRRNVLPKIRDRWPSAAHTVSRAARHIAEGQSLLDLLARSDFERAAFGASLSAKTLRALSVERRRNALRYWIARSGYLLPDTSRLDEIVGPLLAARPDANPFVEWQGCLLRREGDLLTLRERLRSLELDTQAKPASPLDVERALGNLPSPSGQKSHLLPSELKGPQAAFSRKTSGKQDEAVPLVWNVRAQSTFELPGQYGKLELRHAPRGSIDIDALPNELAIRWRRGGERLRPHRGGPSKSLKSLLQSSRVPLAERAQLPLLFDADRLLAVGDFWSDAAIQADEGAKHRGRIVWHRYPSAG